MSDTIETLRAALFATLKDLRDPASPLTLERARAVNDTAQTIINLEKVELQFMEQTGADTTAFIPAPAPTPGEPQRPRLSGPRKWP